MTALFPILSRIMEIRYCTIYVQEDLPTCTENKFTAHTEFILLALSAVIVLHQKIVSSGP